MPRILWNTLTFTLKGGGAMERVVEYIRTQLSALFVIGGYPKSFARDAIDYTTQTLLQHFHLVQVITLLYSGG